MPGFTEKQKEELGEMLDAAVRKARSDVCGCRISNEMKEQMPHFEQGLRAIGEGSIDRGLERSRANNEFVTEVREGKKIVMKSIIRWAGVSLFAFIIWALWIGLVARLANTPKAGGM